MDVTFGAFFGTRACKVNSLFVISDSDPTCSSRIKLWLFVFLPQLQSTGLLGLVFLLSAVASVLRIEVCRYHVLRSMPISCVREDLFNKLPCLCRCVSHGSDWLVYCCLPAVDWLVNHLRMT